jgi:hypothetical protein
MSVPASDRQTLRDLAEEVAEIAALPVQEERKELWRRLNNLDMARPMVWIHEVPWHEMGVDGELELQCEDKFCRGQETLLRWTIYGARHMAADNIVEDIVYSPIVIVDTGYGLKPQFSGPFADSTTASGTDWSIESRHFEPQITEEKDLDKIKTPEVSVDERATEEMHQTLSNIYDGILRVEKRGAAGFWQALWDDLVTWLGVHESYMNLILKPHLVHAALERLTEAALARLEQYDTLNLFSLNNCNLRVGSGGPGYVDGLPQPDFDPQHVRPVDLWGCSTSQILSEVSPEMHEEFAIHYEIRWMERFGLNYYGCCEPLHRKVHLMDKIPNLRKVSMSAWADVDEMAAKVGDRYVLSHKPSPAVLAGPRFDPEAVRRDLKATLDKTRGCNVSLIMKDISTVNSRPERLWEWARVASEVVEESAT